MAGLCDQHNTVGVTCVTSEAKSWGGGHSRTGGHSSRHMEKSMWKRIEVFQQKPAPTCQNLNSTKPAPTCQNLNSLPWNEWVTLQYAVANPIQLSDNYSPSWCANYSDMRDVKPESPSWVASEFLTHRNRVRECFLLLLSHFWGDLLYVNR